jgi:hypothetical protein
MQSASYMRATDFDLDDAITIAAVAEAVGAPPALVERLVRTGILEVVSRDPGEVLLSRRAVIRLRRMQRLRRDLRVNFAGASVIIDLVERILTLDREVAELRRRAGD